jgi:hypothetical protein
MTEVPCQLRVLADLPVIGASCAERQEIEEKFAEMIKAIDLTGGDSSRRQGPQRGRDNRPMPALKDIEFKYNIG